MYKQQGGLATRLRYLLTLSRPRFWLYLVGPVLVGEVYGASSLGELWSTPIWVLVLYFLLPANVFLYGVNDAFDADIDAINPKKGDRERPWHGGAVVTGAVVGAGAAGLTTILVSSPLAWPYLLGFFLLAVAYSVPPFRLKTIPFLDSLANGLYILPGAAAYVTLADQPVPLLALVGAWTWTVAMHAISAVPDVGPDRRAGIHTIAMRLGYRRTAGYCVLWWAVAAIAFGLLDVRMGAVLAIYPVVGAWIGWRQPDIGRVYWWFPALNALAGALLTFGGLWIVAGRPGVIS